MRCIECEEIELARVSDARPSQALEVPYAALDGFPAGRAPADLTRRRLLQWGVAGLAAVYGPKVLGWEHVWNAVAEAAEAGPQKCVLLLYLAGGNDGLNVLLPSAVNTGDFSAYASARPTIGRVAGPDTVRTSDGVKLIGSQPLAGPAGSQLAFANPVVSNAGGGDNGDATYGFDTLYGPGNGAAGSDLAVLPGVDAPNYTLSHFDNSDLWFHGNPGGVVSTGWLGRWVDANGASDNPLQAISIDSALSKSIRTAANPVCAISSLSSLGFSMTSSPKGVSVPAATLTPQITKLAGIGVGDGNAYLGRSRATYGVAAAAYNRGAAIPADTVTPTGYPNTATLSTRLKLAARLFAANLGTRIITIHWGSFDTHSAQQTPQDNQLRELSRALGAFRNDLTVRGIEQNVMTLVFSEFGRRINENGSAGTDHGAGGLMLALGSGVKGGLASQWPGCEPGPEQDRGNLKVTTDFRSVYKAVIDDWLGGDGQAVLGGAKIADLVRGDGESGLFK